MTAPDEPTSDPASLSTDPRLGCLLEPAPVARILAMAVWLTAAVAGTVGVVLSILDGAAVRSFFAVLLLFGLWPAASWLLKRPRPVLLTWSRSQGWWADSLGPLAPPRIQLDLGSWACIELQPRSPSPGVASSICLPLRAVGADPVAWARVRQRLVHFQDVA